MRTAPARALASLLAVLLAGAALSACGSGASGSATPSTTRANAAHSTTGSPARSRAHRMHAVAARRRAEHRRPVPSPGALPQTGVQPRADTRAFHREMAGLWRGIQINSVRPALPAFFPVDAYAQVKTIGDPRGDWKTRLVGDLRLDIAAAHDHLGAEARRDRLVEVLVPSADAHWVPPGVCDNRVGYYEVPNSRVVYRSPDGLASFGIASLISWRGVWYVVHLGEVLRPAVTGVVDDPSPGTGSSVPSSTC